MRVFVPAGTYKTTKPLYVWAGNNYSQPATQIFGDGVGASIIKKTTNTTLADGSPYAAIDAVLILAPQSKSSTQDIYNTTLQDVTISSDAPSAVAFGFRSINECAQIRMNRCDFRGQDICISFNQNVWLSNFTSIAMFPVSKGFSMLASGTSNTLQNTFVYGSSVAGYELRGDYSSANNIACDATVDGIAYLFAFAQWSINGLGAESTVLDSSIVLANKSKVKISAATILASTSAAYECLIVSGDSSLELSMSDIGFNFTTFTSAGKYYRIDGPAGKLTLDQVTVNGTFATANNGSALDSYLQGTWIPALTCGTSGTITVDVADGKYTKVGNLVTVFARLNVVGVSSPVGELRLTGLPFPIGTSGSEGSFAPFAFGLAATATTAIVGTPVASASYAVISKYSAGGVANLAGDVQNGTGMKVSFSYLTS